MMKCKENARFFLSILINEIADTQILTDCSYRLLERVKAFEKKTVGGINVRHKLANLEEKFFRLCTSKD